AVYPAFSRIETTSLRAAAEKGFSVASRTVLDTVTSSRGFFRPQGAIRGLFPRTTVANRQRQSDPAGARCFPRSPRGVNGPLAHAPLWLTDQELAPQAASSRNGPRIATVIPSL